MKGGVRRLAVPKATLATEIVAGWFGNKLEAFMRFAQRGAQAFRGATPSRRARRAGKPQPAGTKLARKAAEHSLGVRKHW
jgi:hypothetical protein